MKRLTIFVVAASASFAIAVSSDAPTVVDYRVDSVTRQLVLVSAAGDQPLAVGATVHSGESLRTGSRSKADLSAPTFAARFSIGAKTRFRLAHDRPGVLLEVERGSLRAVFDRLTGDDDRERLVTTPSAVLAVRGTEYGVEVEKDGDTSIVVFEGTVEVRDTSGKGGIARVGAGQRCRIRKGRPPEAPTAHGLSAGDWDSGRRSERPTGSSGQQNPAAGRGTQPGGNAAQPRSQQGGSKSHGG
jgi:hypothetical protein